MTDIEYMEEELMSRNIEIEDLQAKVEELEGKLKYERTMKSEYLAMLEKRESIAAERHKIVESQQIRIADLESDAAAWRKLMAALDDSKIEPSKTEQLDPAELLKIYGAIRGTHGGAG